MADIAVKEIRTNPSTMTVAKANHRVRIKINNPRLGLGVIPQIWFKAFLSWAKTTEAPINILTKLIIAGKLLKALSA